MLKIWVRVGDQDNYNEFSSLEDAAEYIGESTREPLTRHTQFGVTDADKYRGNNYISLFWGDWDAQPGRELTADELATINVTIQNLS